MRGHSLPELMVGMAIGLGVVGAALMAYTASRQTQDNLQAALGVHHNAHVALRHLQQSMERTGGLFVMTQAGAVQWSAPYNTKFPQLQAQRFTSYSDRLSLGHWQAFEDSDCQGNKASKTELILNDYVLNAKQELTCRDTHASTNNGYQALAEGIEEMRFRFAQANAPHTALVWLNSDEMSQPEHVLAIEICLRVASIEKVQATAPGESCTGQFVAADGRIRRVFRRVVALRHRSGLAP